MRRTMTLALAAALTMAACGDDGGEVSDAASEAVEPGDDAPASADEAPADEASDDDAGADPQEGEPGESDPDGSEGEAEGGTGDGGETESTAVASSAPDASAADKPSVEIPADVPTELERTVLVEGTGDPAETGDTVVVDYVGVRSRDGVEFDNSYDRGEPFPVVLGAGGVIAGWEQGLVGARVGERVQLDIPGDLAYGDQARSDVIGANEALTFVIDVHAIIPQSDPADAPTEAGVPASEGATEVTSVDLVEGEGPVLEEGDTAVLQLVLFRGDNLAALDSTWTFEPIQIPIGEGTLPALREGMAGMKVGGRRAIVAPPDAVFGPDGNPQIGLPADTDAIFVIDLLGVY